MTTNADTCEKLWRLLFADNGARYLEQQLSSMVFQVIKWAKTEYGDVVTVNGGKIWSGESKSHPFLLLCNGRRVLSDSLKKQFDAGQINLELLFDLEASSLVVLVNDSQHFVCSFDYLLHPRKA
jgi:hypothetical protein